MSEYRCAPSSRGILGSPRWRAAAWVVALAAGLSATSPELDARGRRTVEPHRHESQRTEPARELTPAEHLRNETAREESAYRQLDPNVRKDLLAARLGRTAVIDPALPNLRVRLTDKGHQDPDVIRHAWFKVVPQLRSPVSAGQVRVASIVSDPATREAFDATIGAGARQGTEALLAVLTGKTPYSRAALRAALSPLAGMFLIVVGHVEGGPGAFAHRDDGRESLVPIADLVGESRSAGVNLIPAGCESAPFAPVGAVDKLNSVDVVRRIGDALGNMHTDSRVFDLFRALTGPELVLSLSVVEFELHGRMDVATRGGATVNRIYWSPAGQPAQSTGGLTLEFVVTPPWILEKQARDERYYDAYRLGAGLLLFGVILSLCAGLWVILMKEGESAANDALGSLFGHVAAGFAFFLMTGVSASRLAGPGAFLLMLFASITGLAAGWHRMGWLGRSRLIGLIMVALVLLRAKSMD